MLTDTEFRSVMARVAVSADPRAALIAITSRFSPESRADALARFDLAETERAFRDAAPGPAGVPLAGWQYLLDELRPLIIDRAVVANYVRLPDGTVERRLHVEPEHRRQVAVIDQLLREAAGARDALPPGHWLREFRFPGDVAAAVDSGLLQYMHVPGEVWTLVQEPLHVHQLRVVAAIPGALGMEELPRVLQRSQFVRPEVLGSPDAVRDVSRLLRDPRPLTDHQVRMIVSQMMAEDLPYEQAVAKIAPEFGDPYANLAPAPAPVLAPEIPLPTMARAATAPTTGRALPTLHAAAANHSHRPARREITVRPRVADRNLV